MIERIVTTVDEAVAFMEQCYSDQLRKLQTSILVDAVRDGLDLDVDQFEALIVEQREIQKAWLAAFRRKMEFYSVHKRFPTEDAG